MLLAQSEAKACTYYIEETRHLDFSAGVGEVWWLYGEFYELLPGDTIPLVGLEDTPDALAEVLSVGPDISLVLLPPREALPGDSYEVPDEQYPDLRGLPDSLRVVGEVQRPADLVPPLLDVKREEVLRGYESLVVAPLGDTCSRDPGIWRQIYREMDVLTVEVPHGLLLDVVREPLGTTMPASVVAPNHLLIEAFAGPVFEVPLYPPGELGEGFQIRSRFRRSSDGVASSDVIYVVSPEGDDIERIEVAGCSSAGNGATWWTLCLLVALRRLRRRPATSRARHRLGR